MTSPADSSKQIIEIDVHQRVLSGFHKVKDFLTQTAQTLNQSQQLTQDSLTETTAKQPSQNSLTTTQKAVDTITTATTDFVNKITATTQQAKASIEESIEQTKSSADHFKNTASNTMQTAIAASVNDWLQTHPTVAKLVQVLIWATNHPIVSLVMLLFVVAIAWSLIKAISRLLEIAGLSLLQTPFKLGQFLIVNSAKSLGIFGGLAVKQFTVTKNPEISLLPNSNSQLNYQNKQRLAEISLKLEAIRQEQNQLLQEAAAILNSNITDQKFESIDKSTYEQHPN